MNDVKLTNKTSLVISKSEEVKEEQGGISSISKVQASENFTKSETAERIKDMYQQKGHRR